MSELSEISRFRWLIVWLADNLVPEDIHKVQVLLKDQLGNLDTGDDALDILDGLVEQNRIHDEDTGLLRTLFISLGRMDLLEAVDDYEREKKAVVRRLKKNSSVLGGPFFGRQDMLNSVVSVLDTKYDHIHGICISGEEGIGKTRMAQEACVRMKGSHQLVTVDLRGLPSMESVYYAIMHAFGVECREYDLENLFGLLRSYESSQYGSTVLFLDNADSVLDPGSVDNRNPTYAQFIDALKTIMSIPNSGLKVMMTSRFDLDIRAGLSSKTMSAFRLNQNNGLDMDAAVHMFCYHAGNTVIPYEDVKEIAKMCRKNPLVLKVLANRLQNGSTKLKDILPSSSPSQKLDVEQSLSRLQLTQEDDQLHQCLQTSLESLPKKQKLNIIKLAAIPGCFSLDAARKILKYRKRDLAVLQYDLLDLKYLGLLEIKKVDESNQFSDKVARYSIHLSLRSFIIEFVEAEAGDNLKAFHKAQNRFIQFYGKKLKTICKMLQVDACSALSQLQQDSINYIGFLDILRSAEDFKPSENLWWVILAAELLFSPQDGQKFYEHMAKKAKERGDLHAYADLKCYEIMQLKELGHEPEILLLQQLKEVQDILNKKVDSTEDIRSKQLSLATCYCLRGELLTQTNQTSEAIQWLQQAVSLRKQLLGAETGHHFLIARALNSLGVAMETRATSSGSSTILDASAEREAAKGCYLQAYEMCRHLANGSDKHLDIPRYIVHIGDILRELGQHKDAIECMTRGVELDAALGMEGSVALCKTLKKIANSYCDLERYGDAIPIAKQCVEHRKKLSGHVSAPTAEAVYFVGSICLKARNFREARKYLNEALEIEEGLWGRGMSHSNDWQNLKTSIETMMVTLQKQSTLTSYRKRFQDAEAAVNKGHITKGAKVKADATESDDSSSQKSSLPSEISDECPAKPRKFTEQEDESSDSDASSIASEICDELPAVRAKPTANKDQSSSDEESLPSEISDEIPVKRKGVERDSDDDTSSNSSSLPSEISDELPVRVDKNLNHLNKQSDVMDARYTPGKKSYPSGSGDSAMDSASQPSSDELTPPKKLVARGTKEVSP